MPIYSFQCVTTSNGLKDGRGFGRRKIHAIPRCTFQQRLVGLQMSPSKDQYQKDNTDCRKARSARVEFYLDMHSGLSSPCNICGSWVTEEYQLRREPERAQKVEPIRNVFHNYTRRFNQRDKVQLTILQRISTAAANRYSIRWHFLSCTKCPIVLRKVAACSSAVASLVFSNAHSSFWRKVLVAPSRHEAVDRADNGSFDSNAHYPRICGILSLSVDVCFGSVGKPSVSISERNEILYPVNAGILHKILKIKAISGRK